MAGSDCPSLGSRSARPISRAATTVTTTRRETCRIRNFAIFRGLNRKIAKFRIRHVSRRVVVTVVAAREIGRADREPSEGQSEPAIRPTEQLGHDRLALFVGKSAQELRG